MTKKPDNLSHGNMRSRKLPGKPLNILLSRTKKKSLWIFKSEKDQRHYTDHQEKEIYSQDCLLRP